MKVDIITFHFVSNQGGMLQSLALQKFLENRGFEAEVIDYRPPYHTVRYTAKKNPFVYVRWYWKRFRKMKPAKRIFYTFRSFIRCLVLNIKKPDAGVEARFSDFITANLHLTKKYKSLKALRADPPKADAYITGSDQLWNPDLLDFAFDPAYFLDFGDPAIPRISYAVSTGRHLRAAERDQLKALCEKLTAVSLREYDRETVEATGKDVHICIDPTLLLDREAYAPYEAQPQETEPYIFVYGFEDNEEIHKAAEMAVKKYGCRIVNGSPHRVFLDDAAEKLRVYGPDRFLTLVKNAACVVTNSFHGTAFSIIYKKDFITIAHSTRGGRMTELLTKLGLNTNLFGDPVFSFDKTPDYDSADKKLALLREHSAEYLLEALHGVPGERISHYEEEILRIDAPAEPEKPAYCGYLVDREKLSASASGGAATALAESVIRQGGVVFGVEYAEDFKSARYGFTESMDGLKRFAGSKYVYPALKDASGRMIYEIVEEKLLDGRMVLFTGLGCIVGGLLNRLKNNGTDTSRLYTADLICHGPVKDPVQEAFIEWLEEKYHAKVTSFSARYQKHQWSIPYVRAAFSNGKTYVKQLYDTDLGFALKYYCRSACYQCGFKGDSHMADITVGDYWGLVPGMSEYNRDGVSILFPRTDKGEKLIRELEAARFHTEKTDAAFAVKHNPMYVKSAAKPSFYQRFEKDFQTRGLHYAVKHSPGQKAFFKASVIRKIKLLINRK